jgi:hypothetical protein
MVVVGGIYSPNHYSCRCCRWAHRIVRWCTGHCIVQCPVSATSADRWGLERLTVEVFYLLGALDSPVAHRTVRCILTLQADFWLLCCRLRRSQHSRPLGEVDRWSIVSSYSQVAHRTVRWILVDRHWENPRAASSRGAPARTPVSVRCATGYTNCVLLQSNRIPPRSLSLYVCVNFMHLIKDIN